ncbi:hypothetical protein OJF2_72480 [Aquisphaera giovannonii]|uniref:Uncharacterized protein n=1 Tax=Aquisphaera giovannonii TaxID=406548 RepID=A0A5B9WDJ3_9BACT|nr:hypothetical protein [Aquisphaera giovannonii]QEH38642.1 hypothetical protein OJF2_72480 [Aquisphaera giovannonii]
MTVDPTETTDGHPDRPAADSREAVASLLEELPAGILEPFILRSAAALDAIRPESADPRTTDGSDLSFPSPMLSGGDDGTASRPPGDLRTMAAGPQQSPPARQSPIEPANSPIEGGWLQPFLAATPEVDLGVPAGALAEGLPEMAATRIDVPGARASQPRFTDAPDWSQGVPASSDGDPSRGQPPLEVPASAPILEPPVHGGSDLDALLTPRSVGAADLLEQFDGAGRSSIDAALRASRGGPSGSGYLRGGDPWRSVGAAYAGEPSSAGLESLWHVPAAAPGPSTSDASEIRASASAWDASAAIDQMTGAASRLLEAASRLEQAAERIATRRPQGYTSAPPAFRGRVDG